MPDICQHQKVHSQTATLKKGYHFDTPFRLALGFNQLFQVLIPSRGQRGPGSAHGRGQGGYSVASCAHAAAVRRKAHAQTMLVETPWTASALQVEIARPPEARPMRTAPGLCVKEIRTASDAANAGFDVNSCHALPAVPGRG